MKTIASILLLLVASAALAGWSSSGPTGGAVNAVVAAPSDPAVIWAANSAGVFRSADGGATWANVSGPVVEAAFLVVHPADANRAWVLSGSFASARLYRTTDGGVTWIDSTDGLPGVFPSALLIDPRNPDTLYIGSRCAQIGFAAAPVKPLFHETAGVFKSTDGGATWKFVAGLPGLVSNCIEELSIDPFSPWRLFVTGPYSDLAGQSESYDGSTSWTRSTNPRPGLAVVFDQRYPFTHYGISARLGSQFLVSQDGGFTWGSAGGKLPSTPTALSMDPERGRIFLGTYNGIFRSGNGGRVWANTLAPDVKVNALAFGGVPGALFAATEDGLLQVINRGLGASRPIDLHDVSADVLGLAVDPSDPNVVYAGARSAPIYGTLQLRGRVFRSTDSGASWERLEGDDDVLKADFITADAGGTVYAASYGGREVYRRGRTDSKWAVVRKDLFIRDIAADPKNAGTIFIDGSLGIERSRDGGATWKLVIPNTPAGVLAIDPSDPRWVYSGNEYELYRSSDGGDTWTTVEPSDPGKSGTRGLVVAPSNGSVLYRVAANFGRPRIERSDDRATTWRPVPLPNNDYPQAIAVDPRNESSVWASGSSLYHSTDGGATWETVDGPFLATYPPRLLRFDATGRVLHVVYQSHGVWELTLD